MMAKTGIGSLLARHYVSITKFGYTKQLCRRQQHKCREDDFMARPSKHELTGRELEVMHVFWDIGPCTAAEARDRLATNGVDRAYVTIANLVRQLVDKRFLAPVNEERPFRYQAVRSFDDVSQSLVSDLMQRVFGGSRELLLTQLFGEKQKLTAQEREFLRQFLEEHGDE